MVKYGALFNVQAVILVFVGFLFLFRMLVYQVFYHHVSSVLGFIERRTLKFLSANDPKNRIEYKFSILVLDSENIKQFKSLECTICCEEMQEQHAVVGMPCLGDTHVFHK